MHKKKNMARLIMLALMLLTKPATAIIYNAGNLNFSTNNQSLWGSGNGITPETVSYNLSLNSDLSLGGLTGSQNTLITPEVVSPFYYIEGHWDSSSYKAPCWPDITKTCTYDTDEWHDTSYWGTKVTSEAIYGDTRFGTEVKLSTRGNVNLTSNFGVNGGTVDANIEYSDVELNIPDEIKVGEFFNLNPSSTVNSNITTKSPNLEGTISSNIDFSVGYSATECLIIGLCSSSSGTIFNIPSSETTILEVNTDNLDPDKARVFEIDKIAGYDATFDATKAGLSADIYAFPTPGIYLSGIPGLPSVGTGVGINVLELELDAPGRFNISNDTNGEIKAENIINDIVRLDYDLGSFQNIPTGAVLTAGALEFRGDILDIDLTPTLDFNQKIEFKPDLMVELTFSSPVYIKEQIEIGEQLVGCSNSAQLINQICYITVTQMVYKQVEQCVTQTFLGLPYEVCETANVLTPVTSLVADSNTNIYAPLYSTQRVAVTSITAPWDELPSIALIDDTELSVVPKFWINNEFKNQTWLDYDLNVALGLLKGSLDFSILSLWDDCLICEDFLVANLGNFGHFNETFSLQGFDYQYGNAFHLSSKSLPANNNANAIPEPSIFMLMSLGIIGLLIARRKQK